MLDFLWSAQESAGSHTLSLSSLLLFPISLPFPFSLLSLVLSFVSQKIAISVFSSLRLVRLLLLSGLFVFLPLISPPCQSATRSSSPSQHPAMIWCRAALFGVRTCSFMHTCVLEHYHVCLLCEFDTSKGCHELNKSIPSSVLHWQN